MSVVLPAIVIVWLIVAVFAAICLSQAIHLVGKGEPDAGIAMWMMGSAASIISVVGIPILAFEIIPMVSF